MTPNPSPQWTGTSKGPSRGIAAFLFLIRHVGVLPAYILLIPVSFVYCLIDKSLKTGIDALSHHLNLKCTFSSRWGHCYTFGMALLDRLAFLVMDKPPFRFTCIHEERISAALQEGKGVILISAHIGSTEIAGNLLADKLKVPVRPVMLDNERDDMRKIYKKAFDKRSIHPIFLDPTGFGSSVELMNALRNNEIVCMLADRTAGGQTQKVAFLGEEASFPKGPFALARATGAVIIPIFIVKTGLLHYTLSASLQQHIRSRDPLETNAALQSFVKALEATVQKHPFQWFNFYNFWSV